MEKKKLKIVNPSEAGLYSPLCVDAMFAEYFGRQRIMFVPEKSDFYKGQRTFEFSRKYGNTMTTFTNKNKLEWEVEFVGENRGISLTKSVLEEKAGLKFAN